MLETRRGTENGFTVRQYFEGEIYEVREHLARAFLAAGYAIRVTQEEIMRDFQLEILTGPSEEPVTLETVKLFLRVDGDEEDAVIEGMIRAARGAAEQYLRKSLVSQSWKLVFDDYACAETYLPMGPVQEVSSVTLVNNGVETVLGNGQFHLNARKDRLIFDAELFADRVEVVYVAGYGDAEDVPPAIKQGMLVHVAQLYGNRGLDVGMPEGIYAGFRGVRV